jgi:hypothetical protein
MPKIPDYRVLGAPGSLRTGRSVVSAGEVSSAAIGKGLSSLGDDLLRVGIAEQRRTAAERKENDALDLIKADAYHEKYLNEAERGFDTDPEHANYELKFTPLASTITEDAGKQIRNEKLREKWVLQKAFNRTEGARNRILTRGLGLRQQEKVVEVEDALKTFGASYANPNADDGRRNQALSDMEATVGLAEQTGMLLPNQAQNIRERFIGGAVQEDYIRRAEDDPRGVLDEVEGAGQSTIKPGKNGLATITAGSGARVAVSAEHAERFKGALDDLEAAGVVIRPDQTGGFADRNIRGTNTPSQHKFGRAIDINWTENARGTKGKIDPELARMVAKKWGLTWGGDWKNPDPMHFEVAKDAKALPVSERGITTVAGSEPSGPRIPSSPYSLLTPEQQRSVSTSVRGALERLKKEKEREIDGLETLAGDGYEPPLEKIQTLQNEVARFRDPELTQKYERARGLFDLMTSVRKARPGEVEAFARQERKKLQEQGASIESQKLLKAVDQLDTTMQTELKQDALSWATRVGNVSVDPLDLEDPEMLAKRRETAHEVADYYGQSPQFFTLDERKALSETIEAGGEQMLGTLSKIVTTFGPDDSLIAVQEFGKDFSEAASIGWLMASGGSSAAIKDAAQGMELRRSEGFKSMAPPAKDAQSNAVDELGGVLSAYPKSEVAAINMANLIYEVRARKSGETSFNADLWKQGLREALGEEEVNGVTYGGMVSQGWFGASPIILPPTLRQEGWEESLDTITMLDLDKAGLGRPVGATGKPIDLGRLKAGTLVQIGDGRYAIATGDPTTPGDERWVYRDKPGEIFELDFNKLAPSLMKRRPDLFKGAF